MGLGLGLGLGLGFGFGFGLRPVRLRALGGVRVPILTLNLFLTLILTLALTLSLRASERSAACASQRRSAALMRARQAKRSDTSRRSTW